MNLTTSTFVTEVSTVVELVTHPVLRNAAATGTSELATTAGWIFCKAKMFNGSQEADCTFVATSLEM